MINYLKKHQIFLTLFFGATTLYLSYQTFQDQSVASKLDAREKLDQFVKEIENNEDTENDRCDTENNQLFPYWQEYYDELKKIATVTSRDSPYGNPCIVLKPPVGLQFHFFNY